MEGSGGRHDSHPSNRAGAGRRRQFWYVAGRHAARARRRLDRCIDPGDELRREVMLGGVVEVRHEVRCRAERLVPIEVRVVDQAQQRAPHVHRHRMVGPAKSQRRVQRRGAEQFDRTRRAGRGLSHQRFQAVNPRRDLRPAQACIPQGLHDCRAAGELPGGIGCGSETPMAVVENFHGGFGRALHRCAACPVAQPSVGLAHAFGHSGQPVAHRLVPALLEQGLGVAGQADAVPAPQRRRSPRTVFRSPAFRAA